jgi:hypothetical protein
MQMLFVAFAGLVVARDSKVGYDCLVALDRFISDDDANVKSAPPEI